METEILVLFHLLATAPPLSKGIFAKSLLKIQEKANTTQEKPVQLELCSKFLRSQEFLRSPVASSWIHLPPLAGWLPATCTSPGNPPSCGGAPIHFVTSSFLSHKVLSPVPPALLQGLGQLEEEEGFSPAASTSKGCYRDFLINLTPHLKNVKQRESMKAVPC